MGNTNASHAQTTVSHTYSKTTINRDDATTIYIKDGYTERMDISFSKRAFTYCVKHSPEEHERCYQDWELDSIYAVQKHDNNILSIHFENYGSDPKTAHVKDNGNFIYDKLKNTIPHLDAFVIKSTSQ